MNSHVYALDHTAAKTTPGAPQRRDVADTPMLSGWWILPAMLSGAGFWVWLALVIFT